MDALGNNLVESLVLAHPRRIDNLQMSILEKRVIQTHFYHGIDPRWITSLALIQLYFFFRQLLFSKERLASFRSGFIQYLTMKENKSRYLVYFYLDGWGLENARHVTLQPPFLSANLASFGTCYITLHAYYISGGVNVRLVHSSCVLGKTLPSFAQSLSDLRPGLKNGYQSIIGDHHANIAGWYPRID